ncbi:hypothetical protein BB8028_0003g00400 [Beauveria bassiana]|uniref:Uncharacterized protein n=1 Tax=Beauveria bassiana TaxID=176275 RepID=A0A2S7Y5U8_BEABA|nr:hypothetical protein BB8028_0003g00400 [Beauveria bassiana]
MKFATTLLPLLATVVAASSTPVENANLETRQSGIVCYLFTRTSSSFCGTLGSAYPWCPDYFKLGYCLCNANTSPIERKYQCIDDFRDIIR